MKIRLVETELIVRTDGRTDVTKLSVAFRNFANAPKTKQLMLYREIFAAGYENHFEHVNGLCWQKLETFS